MQLLGRYSDDYYEYRHVQLPKQMLKAIPKEYFDGARGTLKLLWEEEWRGLGITQVRAHTNGLEYELLTDNRARVWDGSITKYTSQNHTFCFSSVRSTTSLLCTNDLRSDSHERVALARLQDSTGAVRNFSHDRAGREALE